MPVLSKLFSSLNINHSIGLSSVVIIIIFLNRLIKSRKTKNVRALININLDNNKIKSNGMKRPGINKEFMKSLFNFVKILIPHIFTNEMWLIVLIAISIVGRTMCDVWVVNFTTKIESLIITRQKSAFYRDLKKFLVAAPSISLINNILRFGIERLKLQFRSKLSSYFYRKYMRHYTFYQLANFDNRIKNVDQLLTDDIEKFCSSFVDLYTNISKPILDIIIYLYKLCTALGIQGPGYLLIYLFLSGVLLTKIRQPLTKMIIKEQQFEGEYRFINSRLIANSEEIAFYQGNKKEKDTIKIIFNRLRDHLENVIEFRFFMGIFDNFLAKYVATTVGFFSISRLFFKTGKSPLNNLSHSETMHYYYSNGRMMLNMSLAIGRLVLSGRQLAALAGFTVRIQQLDDLLNEINSGVYNSKLSIGASEIKENEKPIQAMNVAYKDNIIKFEDVPIITPNGDVLINKISFEVKSGCNVLICGPNGCGKSSLFRILSGIWPQFGGKISKPTNFKLFYIPQKPYMTIGNLRDQIIYPDSTDIMKMREIEDHHLYTIMKKVELEYIVTREGGWDSLRDWSEVLSGGEKQRVAMARLFYHKPQFAILDECTSAVSVDVEDTLYTYCREIGITLFTVSHRKSLWKHHEYYLYMDGKGKYSFQHISEEANIFGS